MDREKSPLCPWWLNLLAFKPMKKSAGAIKIKSFVVKLFNMIPFGHDVDTKDNTKDTKDNTKFTKEKLIK